MVADIDLQRAQATAEKSEQVATNPKYRAFPISVDVADPISVQNMVEIAIKEFEMIDYYVHSAGVSTFSIESCYAIFILETCHNLFFR